ncbi:hypothetical protein NE235_21615 [Actinoallomurus spadix]|uniref:Uncharacterized protein n=1 Tax=Actinoallomurus spadix TaxID=79912 RepID=A0ABP3H2E7_9ACTN|nr:hypothetical protein [Actinoallomurus spadix]MCO5988709.1 hypothetical protein [Actinoallomurus spadix]
MTGLAEHGVRSSVVRLPPIVHSPLDHHGFVNILIGIARQAGVSAYVGDGGIPFRDIAAAIGRGLGVSTASISAADATERLAFLGPAVGVDNPASSEVTRKTLGWEPAHPGLLDDLEQGHYFRRG